MKIHKKLTITKADNGAFLVEAEVVTQSAHREDEDYIPITLSFTRVYHLARFLSTVEFDTVPLT